jgi:hypothetical protein
MPKKCDDCISRGISWGKIISIAVPLMAVVAFQAVDSYKNAQDRILTIKVVESLNNTNTELFKKGYIDNLLFIALSDTIETYGLTNNEIAVIP